MPTKNQNWRFLAKTNSGAPAGHLTWWSAAFQLAQTWFTLAWPTLGFFYWFLHMCTENSRGCKLHAWCHRHMHESTNPSKKLFNQLDQNFSSLTNDYCRHENVEQIKVPILLSCNFWKTHHYPDTMIRYEFGNCSQDEVAVLMVDGHSKKKIRVVQSPAIYLIT